MHCIETVNMSVIWNRQKSEWFKLIRGIKQGDSISPYLFVLYMIGAHHQPGSNRRALKPIKLPCPSPPLTHLFFADNLLLLQEASKEHIRIIMNCLDTSCAALGKKSTIAFSSDVDKAVAQNISTISNIPLKPQLEKYLGIPSIIGRINLGTFQHLLDQIEGRLEGWKSKNLTLVVRIILAKFVLTATPSYSMQSTLLPVSLCNNIDKRVRNFLWGSSHEKRRIHVANWDTVTIAKEYRGLGIRNMRSIFMAKLGCLLLIRTGKI